MHRSDAILNERKRGMSADEKVVQLQVLLCFKGFGDDRGEI